MRSLASVLPMLLILACGDDGGGDALTDPSTSGASSSGSSEPTTTSPATTATTSPTTTDPTTATGSSTAAVDSSSATTDPAPFNEYSAQLDGVSAHVNLGSRADVLGSEDGPTTIALWVRLASIPPGDELSGDGIFFIEGKAGFGGGITLFWSTEEADPSIALYTPGIPAGGLRGTPANPTGWTHVAAVYEPDSMARLYLDGRLVIEAAAKGGTIDAMGDVLIGRYLDDTFATEGFFDEVAIWSAALPTEAIESIYSGGPQDLTTEFGDYASADALLGYWRMGDDDEGMGTTVSDVLGNNDGTLVSGAVFSNEVP